MRRSSVNRIGAVIVAAAFPFFLTLSARAEDRDPCPKPSTFVNKIYNCGANELAVKQAQECSDSMMAESKVAGAALAAVMESMRAQLGDAQSLSMTDEAKRLKMGIRQLALQIRRMQGQTQQVSTYTEAMIDFDDGEDDSSSADCFSRNYHALQKVYDGMADEIMKTKAAREAALQMLATVQKRDANLDAALDSFNGKLSDDFIEGKSNGRAPASASHPRKGKEYRPSDVTGTDELAKQKAKAAANQK